MLKPQDEEGIALIMVLAILAIISVWATTSMEEDYIMMRQVENVADSSRASMAAESAIDIARMALEESLKENTYDHLDEMWAKDLPPYPVDDGQVSINIKDANRYLNLNDLVKTDGSADPEMIAIISRLFVNLDVSPHLVGIVVDWIDMNAQVQAGGGAESSAYMSEDYNIKNAPMDRIEELLLMKDFDREIFDKIKAFVIVRPKTAGQTFSKININTASQEVLMALNPQLNLTAVDLLIAERQDVPFQALSTLLVPTWPVPVKNRLDVRSDAFIVRTRARFGRALWGEEVWFERKDMTMQLKYRQRLGWNQ
ncbi:MAG: type II secretion system minor pseudopilin GspK [Mariprofundaceae bacterium]|nr:type II secretion system minor pseudopilin GspK [Mariprofundaceae bacterium]